MAEEDDNGTGRTGISVAVETKQRLEGHRKGRGDEGYGAYTETWDEYLNALLDDLGVTRDLDAFDVHLGD